MTKMTSFQYLEFYDVPRCMVVSYPERSFLLQSAFDEGLDDYLPDYSVYELAESVQVSLKAESWEFLRNSPMTCIGHVPLVEVLFDSSKRREIDASFLDSMMAAQNRRITKVTMKSTNVLDPSPAEREP